MKQNLKIGNVVDDGTGDYLRNGGLKINNNFDDLYGELGDGSIPYSAGAWKTWSLSNGPTLNISFGKSYVVDTTQGEIKVNLPKGTQKDYNKVIRLRDVFSTWSKHPIKVQPSSGDTMKGNAGVVVFNKNFQDLELVYCSPGRWEYLENKFVDKITTSDLSTVAKKNYIATEGQTDFLDVFDGTDYNVGNTNVYRRGNRLYYETDANGGFIADSDFGSPGDTSGSLTVLNGKDIRLKVPCSAGDTITIETYMDGVATWQSSYNRVSLQMLDSSRTESTSEGGARWVGDLSTKLSIDLTDMGIPTGTYINPNAVEVILNGRQLIESGDANLPTAYCDGAFGPTQEECTANGGNWKDSEADYTVVMDGLLVTSIEFGEAFSHKDLLVIKWFNNNIGTTMDLSEILDNTDSRYLNVEEPVNLLNRIEYTDYNKPGASTIRAVTDQYGLQISTLGNMFDIIYPIGTVYENANNPANPKDYMGFGTWVLFAQGRTTVGWNSNSTDPNFALNNNDVDSSGVASHTAGGTVGQTQVQLKLNNIPALESKDKVLIVDDSGSIIVGGCQFDPDSQGPGYTKYREDTLKVNDDIISAIEIPLIQPSITTYKWLRIA